MIRIRRIRANNFKQLQEIDLILPPQGRFLIQGKNEAGKSTLFEAVFFGIFGQALVTESGTRGLDDLIRYGVEKAYVELWLDAPGRLLKIRRTIVRGKSNTWELDIESPERVDEIRGNRLVNTRIVEELGFDADALLNTAFVEQKKLDKLEGMSRSQREQSLMKLLNLEQMTRLENEFRLRAEDRLALQRAAQRAELARIQAELPEKNRQLDEIEVQLQFYELNRLLEAAYQKRNAIVQLDRELQDLVMQQVELADQARQAEELSKRLQTAREIYNLHSLVVKLEQEIAQLQQQVREGKTLQAERLPQLKKEQKAIQMLRDQLTQALQLEEEHRTWTARVTELDEQWKMLQATQEQLVEAQERERTWRTRLEEAKTRAEEATYLSNAFRVRDALRDWVAAQEAAMAPAQPSPELAATREQHAQLNRRYRLEIAAYAAGLFLIILVLSLSTRFVLGLALLALVLLGLLVWRALDAIWDLSVVAKRIGRLEREQELRQAQAEQEQSVVAAAERRLHDLNVVLPSRIERGRQAIADLDERLADWTPASLEAELEAARNQRAQAEAQRDEALREIQRLEATLSATNPAALQSELREARRKATETEATLLTCYQRAAKLAAALDLAMDLERGVGLAVGEVESRLGALSNEIQNVERQIEAVAGLQARMMERQQELDQKWVEVETLYAQVVANHEGLPAWDRERAGEVIREAGMLLRKAYEAAGGDQLRRELDQLQEAGGAKRGELNVHRQQVESHLAQARALIQQLELEDEFPAKPSDSDLEAWLGRIEPLVRQDEQKLRARRDALFGRVSHLQEQQRKLEAELGLKGETVDLEEAEAAYQALRRQQEVREKAREIVELARRRVVEQILPNTMEHMRKVLPTLTMQRYYDAELTDDYRIRVWDERAGQGGDWKEKNIFSGGTKDQFSLALRLAFALATLPEERGSAPSFIFLDEPLGSFDDERARALLYLLTEGEIAQSFDQIFLISHIRVRPEMFNYHITIDQGRVVESDLPEEIETYDLQIAG